MDFERQGSCRKCSNPCTYSPLNPSPCPFNTFLLPHPSFSRCHSSDVPLPFPSSNPSSGANFAVARWKSGQWNDCWVSLSLLVEGREEEGRTRWIFQGGIMSTRRIPDTIRSSLHFPSIQISANFHFSTYLLVLRFFSCDFLFPQRNDSFWHKFSKYF